MSIIRVGSTEKYADGWEAAFSKGKKKAATPANKPAAKSKSAKAKPAAKAKAAPAKKSKKK